MDTQTSAAALWGLELPMAVQGALQRHGVPPRCTNTTQLHQDALPVRPRDCCEGTGPGAGRQGEQGGVTSRAFLGARWTVRTAVQAASVQDKGAALVHIEHQQPIKIIPGSGTS